MRFAIALIVLVIVVAVGGLVLLAQAPLAPPMQKVEQAVPDDHLPR